MSTQVPAAPDRDQQLKREFTLWTAFAFAFAFALCALFVFV